MHTVTISSVRALAGAAALALAAAAAPARAQPTVGTPEPGGGVCLPFGCNAGRTSRFQQVYAAGAFAGPLDIGALTFYHREFRPGSGIFATGTYTLDLSVTSRGPGALTTALADNVGGPQHRFATVTLAGSAAAPTVTVVGTPFRYDPALGHLLAEWRVVPLPFGTPPLDPFQTTYFDADYSGALTSTAWDAEWVPGLTEYTTDDAGLVTTFSPAVTATPEPATFALVAGGAALLVAAGRARGRRGGARA